MSPKAEQSMIRTLREQTNALHPKAHQLPFFKAMFQGQLEKAHYVVLLRAFAVIYGQGEPVKFVACVFITGWNGKRIALLVTSLSPGACGRNSQGTRS